MTEHLKIDGLGYLRALLRCVVCGRIYDCNYQYHKPARCERC